MGGFGFVRERLEGGGLPVLQRDRHGLHAEILELSPCFP